MVAEFKKYTGPATVLRIDLHEAIRITGGLPKGKTVADAAPKCADLAKTEIARLKLAGIEVVNLSAK